MLPYLEGAEAAHGSPAGGTISQLRQKRQAILQRNLTVIHLCNIHAIGHENNLYNLSQEINLFHSNFYHLCSCVKYRMF